MSLTELAKSIAAQAEILDQYIAQNNLPKPSFAADGPPLFPVPLTDEKLQATRLALLKAAEDLAALTLGPVESLRWTAWNQYNDNIAQHAILEFGIAKAVPADKEISFAEVAKKTGLNEDIVTRIIRYAATKYIFVEPRPGYVAHSASSKAIAEDNKVKDWLGMTFEECGPTANRVVDAWKIYPDSQEPNETGFSLANDNDTIFNVLSKDPLRAKRFGAAMASFSDGEGHKVEHLVKNYDWSRIGSGTIVDVGGSLGHISIAIAKQHPEIKFVVQDLPGTVKAGEAALPQEFKERITFMPHNMNDVQPVKGADIYLFRSVLLNWSDKYCVKFLRNLIPALKKGARVVINESCLPEKAGEMAPWDERIIRGLDLCMLSFFNSKERTQQDWKDLFSRSDSRFKILGAYKPAQSLLWIIEAEWTGELEA